MTIAVVNVESLQTGDGSTTIFNGPVAVRAGDVAVYFWDGDDFITLSNGEDFEVTGVGTGNRCTVTISNEDYIPDYDSDGTFLSILSEAEYTQETNIPSTRLTVTDSIELSIDLLTILTQQLDAKLTRSLRTDSRDFPMDGVLPLRDDRAGKVLSFDSEGNPVATNDLTDILGSLAVYDNETLVKSNARTLNFRNGVSAVALESGQVAIDLAFPDGDSLPAQSYDLILDGETDQTDEFVALMDSLVASGSPFNLVGLNDGTSELFLGKRAVIDQMPKDSSIDRVSLVLDTSNQAGIYIRGQQIELPESGKAKLWADVDVSGGAVTSFDISVSANPDVVDLLVAGATVRIRGENGADGEALEGHSHEDTVVSCVLVSGTRYTLTLTNGLPDTVDGSVWKTEWPDSSHTVDPDETLISVLASAKATADMTNSRSMSIDSGKAADLGLEAGQWVEIIDDAVGSDFHGTSNEPLNRQIVKVHSVTAGVDPTDDVITFDDVIMGSYTTAKNARLIMLRECTQFKLRGPGIGFPIRTVGTPPASPESRRHAIEVAYAVRPEITGWVYEYDASDGSTRGTIIRDSVCLEPWIHHNVILGPTPDFAGAFNGGDYYCAWSKGSTRPLVENNVFLGGRHAYVMANAKGGAIRFNNLGLSGFQNLDLHGENEQGVHVYGNRIVRGPKWADRSNHIAIQFGNQTHTYGTREAVCHGNEFIGFDDDDDVGVLIISGCKDISIDEEFLDSIGIGVQIEADRRAPEVLIERISISGSAPGATIGVVIDGRMQPWTSEGEVFGSASRPTYVDDSTGTRRYVTEDEGTLGTVNPTHTAGTETNGDIDLEYVGLIASETVPIDGVRITADLTYSTVDIQQSRASNVTVITGIAPDVEPLSFAGSVIDLPFLEVESNYVVELDTSAFSIVTGDVENSADIQLLRVASPSDDSPAYIWLPEVPRIGRPIRFFSVSPAVSTLDPIYIQGPPLVVTVADVATTSSSADVTVGEYVRDFRPGDPIEHDNFPASTTVLSRDVDAGTLTMSANATATGTADLEVTITNAVFGDRTTGARQFEIPRPIAGNTNGVQFEVVCVSTEPGRPPVYITDQNKSVIEGWYEKPAPDPGGNVTGSVTVSVASVSLYRKTVTGNLTIGLTDLVAGLSNGVYFDLKQDGSGGHTIDITDIDDWIGETPSFPTDAGDRIFFTLYCTDEGEIFGIYTGAIEA